MMKSLCFVLLLALAVSAQMVQQPRRAPKSPRWGAQDPIGDYRLRIQGYVASQDRTIANLNGYVERLTLPEHDTKLVHSILQIQPATGQQVRTQQQQQQRDRQQTPIIHLYSFERKDSIDFFTNPATSIEDLGDCFYAKVDANTADFQIGEWQQDRRQSTCGENQEGTLFSRMMSFTDANNLNVERLETICKSDEEILWFETTESLDGKPRYTIHLDVVDRGEAPQADMQGVSSFSLPAVCVLRPEEVNSVHDLMVNVLSSLGANIGGGAATGRGGLRGFQGRGGQNNIGRDRPLKQPHRQEF